MNQKPLVSVIMATYNCKDSVSKSIESILNQTYTNWEFIICDDCSTDGTYELLLTYKEKYPEKFNIVRNDVNSKLSYSLNHCLKHAKGKYVARMDGDDVSKPERLEKQVEFLEENKEFQVVGCYMEIFDGKEITGIRKYKKCPDKYDLFKYRTFAHGTILMHKFVYDDLGGYTVSKRTVRGQDFDLWIRFFAKGYKGVNIENPLYVVTEDDACYKRKKYKYRINAVQTALMGCKMLNMPFKYYILAIKPMIAGLVPSAIMKKLHKAK